MDYLDINEIEKQIEVLVAESGMEIARWNDMPSEIIERSASNLDGWDFCFSIAIGLVSHFISTNEELQNYLKKIHDAASEANGDYDFLQQALGTLLHHKGDPIDQINRKFIKRDYENAYVLFHRLLWGHDIISIQADNPFYLMIKKQGLSGIIQALQHLLADTTSKQGLPFPGSSYLDYIDETENLSNYVIKLTQQLSINTTGNKRVAQEIYAHMFTIRAGDLLGTGANTALSKVYFRIRRCDDEIRKLQFNFISYSVSFWGQALIGLGRLGVPYINISIGTAMVKSFVDLFASNHARTKRLISEGHRFAQETDRLVKATESILPDRGTSSSKLDVLEEIEQGQENASYLIRIWEENLNEDE